MLSNWRWRVLFFEISSLFSSVCRTLSVLLCQLCLMVSHTPCRHQILVIDVCSLEVFSVCFVGHTCPRAGMSRLAVFVFIDAWVLGPFAHMSASSCVSGLTCDYCLSTYFNISGFSPQHFTYSQTCVTSENQAP